MMQVEDDGGDLKMREEIKADALSKTQVDFNRIGKAMVMPDPIASEQYKTPKQRSEDKREASKDDEDDEERTSKPE